MKVLVSSIGTRGDMEPFLTIGVLLKQKGHEVVCLFPEQFRHLAKDARLGFESLGTEFIEMLESDLGKFALGGSGSKLRKIRAFIKLAEVQKVNNQNMVRLQQEAFEKFEPDRIIYNGKVMYPVIHESNKPGSTVMISPVPLLHYVKGNTHLAFNSNYGSFLNKLTFKIADWGLLRAIMTSVKWLKLLDIKKNQIKSTLKTRKVIYTISQQLFPRPVHWTDNLKVLGYHERNKQLNWTPDDALLEFLGKHQKIVFITFGSMTNPTPDVKSKIITDVLEKHQIPAIINTAAGGLVEPTHYDQNIIHFVKQVPYDWIFPKMYAAIHHGGSGTTHLSLKYKCATMIVPHIIDQFVWNKIIHKLNAGPKGPKISKLNTKIFERKLLELINTDTYKSNAEAIASKMEIEHLETEFYNALIE